jgi:hypothetical protein
MVDVDVRRFAAHTRLRRLQLVAAFEALVLAGTACLAPLMVLPAHVGSVAFRSAPMHVIVPFDASARRMPPAHIVSIGWWTCAPHDPTQLMSEWELEAKFARELYGIDCANWVW